MEDDFFPQSPPSTSNAENLQSDSSSYYLIIDSSTSSSSNQLSAAAQHQIPTQNIYRSHRSNSSSSLKSLSAEHNKKKSTNTSSGNVSANSNNRIPPLYSSNTLSVNLSGKTSKKSSPRPPTASLSQQQQQQQNLLANGSIASASYFEEDGGSIFESSADSISSASSFSTSHLPFIDELFVVSSSFKLFSAPERLQWQLESINSQISKDQACPAGSNTAVVASMTLFDEPLSSSSVKRSMPFSSSASNPAQASGFYDYKPALDRAQLEEDAMLLMMMANEEEPGSGSGNAAANSVSPLSSSPVFSAFSTTATMSAAATATISTSAYSSSSAALSSSSSFDNLVQHSSAKDTSSSSPPHRSLSLHTSPVLVSQQYQGFISPRLNLQQQQKQVLQNQQKLSGNPNIISSSAAGDSNNSNNNNNASSSSSFNNNNNNNASNTSINSSKKGILTLNSQVYHIFTRHRIVFSIDLSCSLGIIDPASGQVLFDRIYQCLEKFLRVLILPVVLPGEVQIIPEIIFSIVAQGSFERPIHCIIQGAMVNAENIEDVLAKVLRKMRDAESSAATALSSNEPFDAPSSWAPSDIAYALQNAMAALDFLPEDACPSIVLLTDGVCFLPSHSISYEGLIMKMNRMDIGLTIVNVVGKAATNYLYGYIPDFGSEKDAVQ